MNIFVTVLKTHNKSFWPTEMHAKRSRIFIPPTSHSNMQLENVTKTLWKIPIGRLTWHWVCDCSFLLLPPFCKTKQSVKAERTRELKVKRRLQTDKASEKIFQRC